MLCVLAANVNRKTAAEQDDVTDTRTNPSPDIALSSIADDVATNLDDEWEQSVDDLVSWTYTLDL